MAQPSDEMIVREYDPSVDEGFVYSTWLKNFRSTRRELPPKAYYTTYHKFIDLLLARDDTHVAVASPADDHRAILGWVCWSDVGAVKVLHYTHTKGTYRGIGVEAALARRAGVSDAEALAYTFDSRQVQRMAKPVERAEYVPVEEFIDG